MPVACRSTSPGAHGWHACQHVPLSYSVPQRLGPGQGSPLPSLTCQPGEEARNTGGSGCSPLLPWVCYPVDPAPAGAGCSTWFLPSKQFRGHVVRMTKAGAPLRASCGLSVRRFQVVCGVVLDSAPTQQRRSRSVYSHCNSQ